jgi:general stress protein YciG
MSPDRRREVARAGGRAAQARGSAHRWTSDEARAAGKKGGRIASRKRRGHHHPDE